jgi:hypothetical protein
MIHDGVLYRQVHDMKSMTDLQMVFVRAWGSFSHEEDDDCVIELDARIKHDL